MKHYEKSISNPQEFEKDNQRLIAWSKKYNIELLDEPESIVKSIDRIEVIDKMKVFLKN